MTPTFRATRFSVAVGVLTAAVLGWNFYRATALDVTHDEAITYLRFVSGGPRAVFNAAIYDANNHVLYSLLAWVSTSLFGVNEPALRLPAVLAGGFVVVAAARFFRLLAGPTPLAMSGVLAVVLNPLVMDFLVAARGYGLGLGFSLWAWGSLIHGLQSDGRRPLISAGVSQGLAVGANLVFVYPNLTLAVVFLTLVLVRSQTPRGYIAGRLVTFYIIPGAAMAAGLSFPIFQHLGGEHFYYGTESLFATAESLVEPLLPPAGRDRVAPITGVAVAAFLVSLIPSVGAAAGLRRGDSSTVMDALIYGGTVGTLGLLLVIRAAAGTPYPQDRTGLYFIPLVTACLVLGFRRRFAVVGPVALGVLALYSTTLAQTECLTLWRYDAGTGRVYRLLAARAAKRPGLTVGHDWRFEPTLNYYNGLAEPRPFPWFDRRGPVGDYDLYYLEAETAEKWQARGGYRVVYEDPVSGAVVMEREW
ncbi:MAG TPA: hypothetical protein VM597_27670 [Gemmataceae bacterium]|nr:hypothetical protein [Gemmataceae bacterium]